MLNLDETCKVPELANRAGIDWNLVIDLDPSSQIDGALKYCRNSIAMRRALHVVVPDGNLVGDISRSTYWYFANGLQIAADPPEDLKFREWVRALWEGSIDQN